MTWRHWKTGEIWQSAGDYVYHLLIQQQVYSEEARKGLQRYYAKLKK
jgi:hypothetical protein